MITKVLDEQHSISKRLKLFKQEKTYSAKGMRYEFIFVAEKKRYGNEKSKPIPAV